MSARSCCCEATGWIAPSVGLALIPKCPACVAAYVAAITGAGISIPVAAGLRLGVLILCGSALAFFAARAVARLIKQQGGLSLRRLRPRLWISESSSASMKDRA